MPDLTEDRTIWVSSKNQLTSINSKSSSASASCHQTNKMTSESSLQEHPETVINSIRNILAKSTITQRLEKISAISERLEKIWAIIDF
jgi:hypothetical protein